MIEQVVAYGNAEGGDVFGVMINGVGLGIKTLQT